MSKAYILRGNEIFISGECKSYDAGSDDFAYVLIGETWYITHPSNVIIKTKAGTNNAQN